MSDPFPRATACAAEADWRFLLPGATAPAFEHLVLLGGSPELEETLLALGVARRISRSPQPDDRADAVIVLAGALVPVDRVAQCLSPDGVLYWEVDRRARGQFTLTPGRAAKRLRRLGLNQTAAYWVKPGFSNRQMYLPLGVLGAFRWYLNTLYRSRALPRRLLSAAFRALATDHRGLTACAPCFAVTAVRGAARPPALIERARLEGVAISDDALPVLLAHGRTEWNRIVMLLFEPNASAPTAAMKFPRMSMFNERIEWEHDVLGTLKSDLGPPMSESIPASTRFDWNDLAVSTQTCVKGASLHSRAGPTASEASGDLRHTAGWLAAFHRKTMLDRVPAREWVAERLVNGFCKEYAATFGLTAEEAHLFDTLARRAPAVTGSLPIVWQHADFCPQNVYLDHDRVSVIDWETARQGPVLADLLSFIAYWGAAVGGCVNDAERLDHFDSLFFGAQPSSGLRSTVHNAIAEYMRRVDVPPALLPFLLVYTFLEKALEDAPRLARLEPSKVPSRARNLEVGYVGTLARHADRLFGRSAPVLNADAARADVTVAVATINRPSQLVRCVTAILAGSTLPAELVIVDQSPDDRTADAIAAAGWERRVRLIYRRQPRRGLAASRNLATARASRPIMVFTDDDCVPDEGWLAGIAAAFDGASQPDAVTGRILPLGPDEPGLHAMSTHTSCVPAVYRGRSLPWAVGSGANTAVTRRFLERIGGFDERLGAGAPSQSAEDLDLIYRLLRAGATIRYEPDAVIFHERTDAARRLATSFSYGLGMGAFCALWARRRDPYAVVMLAAWCLDRGRALAGACVRRRWWRVPEELQMLRGAARGIGDSLRWPRSQEPQANPPGAQETGGVSLVASEKTA